MTRLHEGPLHELLAEIALGEHAPGEMLPREVDLAERFDISRGVLREVTRGLEDRGVVIVKHGRGATVQEPDEWEVLDPEVLEAVLASPAGDALVDEALECQRLLEVEAAGLAAERAAPEDLQALADAVERLAAEAARTSRTPSAVQRHREAELDLHRIVVRASGNRPLGRMSAALHRALMTVAGARDNKRRLAEHRAIVAAITDGDADAARAAMAKHLGTGRRGRRRKG